MKPFLSLILFASAAFAQTDLQAKFVKAKSSSANAGEYTPVAEERWMLYEVSFTPDPGISEEVKLFRIVLEYTDLNGVEHEESKVVERTEKITVLFRPSPFAFGKCTIQPLKPTTSVAFPVINPVELIEGMMRR